MSTKKSTRKPMPLIDFTMSPAQAFHRSFLRGLAPNALFQAGSVTALPYKVQTLPPVESVQQSIESDWGSLAGC